MIDKTIINNWGRKPKWWQFWRKPSTGTLQTWIDGEWHILYARDLAGNCVTLSLNSSEACRLAFAISPEPGACHQRAREANSAVYELSYPEVRADSLRQIADEIECDGGCEHCSQSKIERGDFCGFVAADDLRKLAAALDLKAQVKQLESVQ